MSRSKITFILLIIGVIGLMIFARFSKEIEVSPYTAFAECIAESGATFYGAFWCPHCIEQKEMFGNAAKLLPYVECSAPDKESQTQVCKDAGIDAYPTWEFSDGTRETGAFVLSELSVRTNCPLPDES